MVRVPSQRTEAREAGGASQAGSRIGAFLVALSFWRQRDFGWLNSITLRRRWWHVEL